MTSEHDPNGWDRHKRGAKLDGGKLRPGLVFSSMPRALSAVVKVAGHGADKYAEDGWLSVPDGVGRYTDAMDRHRLAEPLERNDRDSGLRHAAHLAWNALARLELMLREEELDDEAFREAFMRKYDKRPSGSD